MRVKGQAVFWNGRSEASFAIELHIPDVDQSTPEGEVRAKTHAWNALLRYASESISASQTLR